MAPQDHFRAPLTDKPLGVPFPWGSQQFQGSRALLWVDRFTFRLVSFVARAQISLILLPLCSRAILECSCVSLFIVLLNQCVQSETQEKVHKTLLNFSFCCCFSSNVCLREATCSNTCFVGTEPLWKILTFMVNASLGQLVQRHLYHQAWHSLTQWLEDISMRFVL